MIEYKCWRDGKVGTDVIRAKTPEEAAADYMKRSLPVSVWPEGWPDDRGEPITIVVHNHGKFWVWPHTEAVPKSALTEEYRDRYARVTGVWFSASRENP